MATHDYFLKNLKMHLSFLHFGCTEVKYGSMHLLLQMFLVLYIYMDHSYNSFKMSFNEYCFGRLYSIFGFAEMHEVIFCICCLPRKHSTNLVNDCSLYLLLRMLTLDSDNSGLISAYPQPWFVNFSTLLKILHLSVMTYKCLIFNLQ